MEKVVDESGQENSLAVSRDTLNGNGNCGFLVPLRPPIGYGVDSVLTLKVSFTTWR